MWHPIKHLATITNHHMLVQHYCFRCGLVYQGLVHDLSKLSPVEFIPGAIYYQGKRSPNDAQRKAEGYSSAWLHHKGRNKHHLEYWIDYSPKPDVAVEGMRMPARYLAEMVCDRIAASKVYNGENYRDSYPLEYFQNGKGHLLLHPDTCKELTFCLTLLKDKGEDVLFHYIRTRLLKGKTYKG